MHPIDSEFFPISILLGRLTAANYNVHSESPQWKESLHSKVDFDTVEGNKYNAENPPYWVLYTLSHLTKLLQNPPQLFPYI